MGFGSKNIAESPTADELIKLLKTHSWNTAVRLLKEKKEEVRLEGQI